MMVQDPLTIVNGNWGGTSLSAVRSVLDSAASVLCDAFEKRADAPIRVAWWSQPPRVFHDYRPYEIRISARDTYWCQYAYQFSHELCHVLVNYDRTRDHRHKWFEESLCELAALFVLRRLPAVWKDRPPPEIVDAVAFAPHFGTYAKDVAKVDFASDRADLPAWLPKHLDLLEADRYNRKRNRIVAVAFLDRFLDDPSLWRDCGWLNCWNASADRSFADHLDSWTARLHEQGLTARTPDLIKAAFFANSR